MSKFYSATTGGFYDSSIHDPSGIPDDAKAITDAEHTKLLIGQSSGKEITASSDGMPILTDPVPTADELAATGRDWRDGELRRADIEISKAEDIIGAFNAETWRAYRIALRDWPADPLFPDPASRPVSP